MMLLQRLRRNKSAEILKTGRFDNIESAVIISSARKYKRVLYCLAYIADDDSCIYVFETSSFKYYNVINYIHVATLLTCSHISGEQEIIVNLASQNTVQFFTTAVITTL